MTPVEEFVYNGVLAQSGVTDLLGRNLFLVQLPQNPPEYPVAVYQRISTVRQYASFSQNDTGWCRFQFTIWSLTGSLSLQIAQAIIAALATFSAAPRPSGAQPNFVLNQRMEIEPQVQPPLFKSILDVRIFFEDQ